MAIYFDKKMASMSDSGPAVFRGRACLSDMCFLKESMMYIFFLSSRLRSAASFCKTSFVGRSLWVMYKYELAREKLVNKIAYRKKKKNGVNVLTLVPLLTLS